MLSKIKNWFVNIWLWIKLKIRKILVALGIVSICIAAPLAMPKENLTFERLENVVKLEENYLMDFDEDFEIEIGDFKTLDFKPEANLKRWGDECFLKVKYSTAKRIKPIQEDNKLKWKDNKEEVHFYNIQETAEKEEAFEFEIILKEKPKTNIVSLEIETKGLDFFYQPDLTQKEIDDGMRRPENIVGSYAVYHSTKTGDYETIGGKNYKAGKAFHIYRPEIIDSAGKEVWGKLNIVSKNGIGFLTVEIPQEFLDNAVYPIIVDPTFGYETQGGSIFDYLTDAIHSVKFASSGVGTVSKISVYLKQVFTSEKIKCALYDSSKNLVTNGETEERANINSSGWFDFTFSTPPTLADADYYLAIWGDDMTSGETYCDANASADSGSEAETYDGSFPASISSGVLNYDLSVYATFKYNTPSAGADSWLSGWDKRIRVLAKPYYVDTNITQFPLLLTLGTSVGGNEQDVSAVFDELTSDGNRKKIAVTKDDGTSELYVEIEDWDDATETATLWVSKSDWTLSSSADTELYLYYDKDHADNTTYVDDVNTGNSHNVWETANKLTHHMEENPAGGATPDGSDEMFDSTSNNNDGNTGGTMTSGDQVAGQIDGSVDFDGSNDYVDCGSDASLDVSNELTIETWFKTTQISYGGLVSFDDETTDANISYMIYIPGKDAIQAWIADGSNYQVIKKTGTSDGQWHHVVFVLDASHLNLYVDGIAITPVARTVNPRVDVSNILKIGRFSETAYFNGTRDQVRIYNRALSADEIETGYYNGKDELVSWGSEENAPSGERRIIITN